MFTLNYNQPSEYRFSLDSIFFANKIVELYQAKKNLSHYRCLDLCAGCGVIGLEIYFHRRDITCFDFLEIQEIYRPFFETNLAQFSPRPAFNFVQKNYRDHQGEYDLIVCNPPYFFPEEGVLSPSDFKNRCRFFLDASFDELIKSILSLLARGGEAYLLINPSEIYGKNRFEEIRKKLSNEYVLERVGKIRITDLVMIRKF